MTSLKLRSGIGSGSCTAV